MDIKFLSDVEVGSLATDIISWFEDNKTVFVPKWKGHLDKMYHSDKHPVNNKSIYPDSVEGNGSIDKVTRVSQNMARQAVTTFTGLCCGIPIKRIYNLERNAEGVEDEKQVEAQQLIERIYKTNRIESLNLTRYEYLFASCEFLTLWYAVPQENRVYGTESKVKIRNKTFSPIKGDKIYPIFDDYGDYIAVGIKYYVRSKSELVGYFDVYTDTLHFRAVNDDDDNWQVDLVEKIELGKNPTVYSYRNRALYEDGMSKCYEREWMLSRNGNYLRKNSAPIFGVFTDDQINFGDEESQDKAFKHVVQYPAGSTAGYLTWQQAIDNLKFQDEKLQHMFFDEIGIPDLSYTEMSKLQLSGEAYSQVFIAAIMKVLREQGDIIETQSREFNIIREFAKSIRPDLSDTIDTLEVDFIVTPFAINDEANRINNIISATGGKAVMSQLEGIKKLGFSRDPKETLKQIKDEEGVDIFS